MITFGTLVRREQSRQTNESSAMQRKNQAKDSSISLADVFSPAGRKDGRMEDRKTPDRRNIHIPKLARNPGSLRPSHGLVGSGEYAAYEPKPGVSVDPIVNQKPPILNISATDNMGCSRLESSPNPQDRTKANVLPEKNSNTPAITIRRPPMK
jgi:hypothetical protein